MSNHFEIEFDDEHNLIDFLDGSILADKPEERVRQKYLRILHYEYNYPKNVIAKEVALYYGSDYLRDEEGNPKRADIVVYENNLAREQKDQGQIRFIVETKAPDVDSGYNQLVSYIFVTSSNGAVWYNGQTKYFRRLSIPTNSLIPWPGIPQPDEDWEAIGRLTKSDLVPPKDIKGLLKRCHDKLFSRGAAGDDLTLDMVRILIAKYRDEEKASDIPEFYCIPQEYVSPEGRRNVAERVKRLFGEFRDANPLVFTEHETIHVGDDQIVEVVSELQHYRLISDDVNQWDIMGAVYEEYTADVLKKEGGEFFTNRLVVNFLVKILNPDPDDIILDPSGGTGGFCTAALRHIRHEINQSTRQEAIKKRLLDQVVNHIFYIDIKNRLVKISKTAMLLTGDGHTGLIQGDSLGPISRLDPAFLTRCKPGSVTKLLTNPPFAGLQNGRITDPNILVQFSLGRKWDWIDEKYEATEELSRVGVPPEALFVERCIEWVSPGGYIGIVQPKGVLDTTDPHIATRHLIFNKCYVRAVITCHKNTFQPYTGTRTALLILQKKEEETNFSNDTDYPIFMAISKKIGQDSEGNLVYKKDENGKNTSVIDHDLLEILDQWEKFKSGDFSPSEFCYSINKNNLDQTTLNINPQRYLPSLNISIKKSIEMGEKDGWSVTTIGNIANKVYKGNRYRREDLETEDIDKPDVRIYYTPGALLQDKGESVKYLDLSNVPEDRVKMLVKHTLVRGQILITRSGSVGRVIFVTKKHDGHIGSDDLIRVEIENENLRFYVYGFLKTKLGQDQMKINEYGTIQQHLEPRHIEDIIIPIPDDESIIESIALKMKKSIEAQETSFDLENESINQLISYT